MEKVELGETTQCIDCWSNSGIGEMGRPMTMRTNGKMKAGPKISTSVKNVE